MKYPKRLIEVDLPIKAISAHARREKSIRHGHLSTLHIWWARRPLAACRAVICASLWPDPDDDLCPPEFQERAAKALCGFAAKVRSQKHLGDLCQVSGKRWQRTEEPSLNGEVRCAWELRYALLEFIADFANWDASNVPEFLDTARTITQAAHEALGGASGTRPLVIDPFAGGGSMPLEALRVGADTFASDLNPVAVLLNKVMLEHIPQFGHHLAENVRKWGKWLKQEAERKIGDCYPRDADGATPIAYLWARTIKCEGPGCGAEIPLVRSLVISKRSKKNIGIKLSKTESPGEIAVELIENSEMGRIGSGTSRGGAATCPLCQHTTAVERVRLQLAGRSGGASDARLLLVVMDRVSGPGRAYRLPTSNDLQTLRSVPDLLKEISMRSGDPFTVPNEPLNHLRGFFNVVLYGMTKWGDLFAPRQQLALLTFWGLLRDRLPVELADAGHSGSEVSAIVSTLACALGRATNAWSSVCRWNPGGEKVEGTFARQALPMLWDFAEANPFSDSTGNWDGAIDWVADVCDANASVAGMSAQAVRSSATSHPLPTDSADLLATDPPYYDAVPYADLSDYFYVWHRRALGRVHPDLFGDSLTPKEDECVVLAHRAAMYRNKNNEFFEDRITKALGEARRVVRPSGCGVVVFANKSTAGWEAMLAGLIGSGWVITGSWPIDTERAVRLRAHDSAALASSIHIVCRPRENPDGSLRMDDIGDWRDVLTELPKRIHEWMPRLAREGVVGADAIFACLGPALEIFSQYSSVEDAAGNEIKLKMYLEKVWETVAKEALSVIFSGADAVGFEPDARLTAMWLWTLFSAASAAANGAGSDEDDVEDDEDTKKAKPKVKGFSLEYDAARKIAQGLGADLEIMSALVEVKGETARLLAVDERRKALFGRADASSADIKTKAAKKKGQLGLGFKGDPDEEPSSDVTFGVGAGPVQPGQTVLDRVHQAMILFGANQGATLKRFLVEQQVGQDNRFWSLADHLSKLYPASSSEKRLVDGVLARKKGLGF